MEAQPCIFGAAPDAATTLACEVVRVIDGDTVVVEVRQQYHVRLLDCWAKELHGPDKDIGLASKQHLAEAVQHLGRTGIVSIPWHEDSAKSWSMGRTLGRVWLGGEELSEIQVSSGHATKTKEG